MQALRDYAHGEVPLQLLGNLGPRQSVGRQYSSLANKLIAVDAASFTFGLFKIMLVELAPQHD